MSTLLPEKNPEKPLCQPSSALQSGTTSSTLSTLNWGKTLDKPLVSRKSLASKPLPNPGEPVGPLPVSQGSEVAVPTGLVKPLLVTCAGPVGCSLLSKPGGNGTGCATSTKGDTLPPPLLLPLVCQV